MGFWRRARDVAVFNEGQVVVLARLLALAVYHFWLWYLAFLVACGSCR
jgi:hypothetical protein